MTAELENELLAHLCKRIVTLEHKVEFIEEETETSFPKRVTMQDQIEALLARMHELEKKVKEIQK